tara:strand:- start:287 stop:490 length:204 start_codon:yes stop_codon:yes gene_type:complete
MATKPISYLEFKLDLEMAYVSTFERDRWVQEQYDKYLEKFYNTQKKSGECQALSILLSKPKINKQSQ